MVECLEITPVRLSISLWLFQRQLCAVMLGQHLTLLLEACLPNDCFSSSSERRPQFLSSLICILYDL